ncbi:Retrovirus-related Pol polyprotein from transposon 17.6 [Takifugu flavidus]|uniref:Gypsy retrotransposon integrase-like protein 1 n=1 Tax=Takifugu flavidus TaxID=433684 RepID=A0A5C6NAA8_9TELE|nr:Retrovirus-related Pol polyprotein from transposon 17.6 [Takifugu flavidus]
MSQGGTPGQPGGPRTPTLPSPLERRVEAHAAQLSSLQSELTKGFPTIQGEISELQSSSQTTSSTLSALSNQMAAMATVLASILQKLGSDPGGAAPPEPSLPLSPRAEPNLASPRVFGGDFDLGKGFLHQCELLFRHQPSRFVSDEAKVGFITSLLADKALSWAIAAVDLDPRLSSDYSAFRREFKAVFEHPTYGEDAASRLLALQQGSRSVAEYTLEFRILAAESRWGETALRSAYRRGLSEAIKDLIVRDRPSSLNELITLSLQMDERLRERRQERAQRAGGSNRQLSHRTPLLPLTSPLPALPPRLLTSPYYPQLTPPPEPERNPCRSADPVSHGRSGSKDSETSCACTAETMATSSKPAPSDQKGLLTSRGSTGEPAVIPQPTEQHNRLFPATLSWDKESIPAIDGRSLGNITHRTIPLTLTLSGNHIESTRFLVLHAPTAPLVLGRPWLERHDPHISWASGRILGWSVACHANCLRSAPSPSSNPRPALTPPDLTGVPPIYHDLAPVFSKDNALSLPPHRPYDCPIDLLPGAPYPTGRLYNLSIPEKEVMRNYITESLASGIIRPSSSPLAAGFFFVAKKDGGLRPCIDFRKLNNITVKNKYPLPLMSSTFEPLTHARVFTKLDLRNAYHLVRIRKGDEWKTAFNTHLGHFEYLVMPFGLSNAPAVFQELVNDVLRDMINVFVVVYLDDILVFSRTMEEHHQHVRLVLQRLLENRLFIKAEKCVFHSASVGYLGYIVEEGRVRADPAKIQAVVEWPRPTDRTQLRRFLGFAGFIRRFIKGFSQVAAPLSALTSTSRPFTWTPEAETAFSALKDRFTTAPVLAHPDPARQFIVEVDASDAGIGAVLSQRSEADQKIHPCAYFSHRFDPAERNYDVGNRELLAVYAALVEWRHWLEGARHPFLVWSDHKNLTYVRTAKRLNPRQGRWALFFSRFDFTLTFRPGVISWPIETAVEQAQRDEPDPGNGPQDQMFVPSSVRPQVLEWGHSSCFACHPGVRRTAEFVQRRFWWPNLQEDVREFVGACTVCARSKASHRSPAGLLHPLPVPSRPWSHIALDFVTGLPVSQGNDTILTIVDRFSKGVHFVALPKLPSAPETAELLVSHVVRLHGIPLDLVSDRGPQFTSRVWQAFCKGIGATVSLTSGYHPQSNGQAEQANQALEAALRCVTTSNPASWSKFLPWVEYSLNAMESSATGMSPFQCFLGYQPPLFPQQELEIAVPSTRAHLPAGRRIWKAARKAILRATEQSRRFGQPAKEAGPCLPAWPEGLATSQTSSRKLNPRYIGPYTICSIINPSAVRLDLPAALKVLSDGEPVWRVNKLLAVRRRGRGFQYLVDWVGYGPEDRSWVPPSYLADPSLLEDFYRDHPDAPGRSSGASRSPATPQLLRVSPCSSATFLAPLPLPSSSSPSSDGFPLASGQLDSPADSRPRISDLNTVKKGINWPCVTRSHGDVQLRIVSIAVEADAVAPDDVPKRKHVKIKKAWT